MKAKQEGLHGGWQLADRTFLFLLLAAYGACYMEDAAGGGHKALQSRRSRSITAGTPAGHVRLEENWSMA